MTGSIAANLHEGSRSEILADYLFSAWGTITPVRRQDDHGLDLYGGMTERAGRRAVVTDYYVVQVKSNLDPWIFEGGEAVRWLVNCPTPMFLACVDKQQLALSVYQLAPRLLAQLLGQLPDRLELVPEVGDSGNVVQWGSDCRYSLSAPIMRVTMGDLLDGARLALLRDVFQKWVRIDSDNGLRLRTGLLRVRVPHAYSVNAVPIVDTEVGNFAPQDAYLQPGLRTLAEAASCLGSQFAGRGDKKGALLAVLLLRHLQSQYKEMMETWHAPAGALPPALAKCVADGLNACFKECAPYRLAGIARAESILYGDPAIRDFLDGAAAQHCAAADGRPQAGDRG